MKKLAALGSVALVAIALTGCSASTQSTDASSTPAPSASSAAPADAVAAPEATQDAGAPAENKDLSERGNPTIKLGDKTTVSGKDGQPMVEYTLTSFDPNPKCNNGTGWEPSNGHFVAVEVEAQSFKGVSEVYTSGWELASYDFKVIRPDGTTSNADVVTMPSLNCLKSKDRIVEIGDNEKAKGWIVMDVEEPEGTLVYKDSYSGSTWELEYPTK